MAINVFVSYDLDRAPPERYEAVRKVIEANSIKYSWIQFSLAYVKTNSTIEELASQVRAVMFPTDKLAVIHALDANISPLSQEFFGTLQREFVAA